MKKMILTLVALLSMTAVMAQNDNKERKAPKEMNPEEMTNRMTKDLELTADQKAKVLALNTEYKDVLRVHVPTDRRVLPNSSSVLSAPS